MARSVAQRRKAGDLPALRIEMWYALLTAIDVMNDPDSSPELRLRCVHAISQIGGVYVNMLKIGDMEARMLKVEQALQLRRNGHGQP
jgi:hypothetical protein